jgi:TPP-dependent pyruvate/acetoin dehydrogenase alpha subunit
MDVVAVETASHEAANIVRNTGCPYLVEYQTYRFRAHSMYDPDLYRSKEEIEQWKRRDPILTFEKALRDNGLYSDADSAAIEAYVEQQIQEAVELAEAGPWEPVQDLMKDVYTSKVQSPKEMKAAI